MNEAIEIQLTDLDLERFEEQWNKGLQPKIEYEECGHKIILRYFGKKLR